MKFLTTIIVGLLSILASAVSSAQNVNMMNGDGMWGSGWMGGYSGYWGPILMIVVVGVVVWVILRKRK